MKIGLIDLNTGNMGSLISAMSKLNIKIKICNSKNDLSEVSKIILPGVGAYKSGMKFLKKTYLDEKLYDYLERPNSFIYGICLGMQLLFDKSYEFSKTKGLGLIDGEVVKFGNVNTDSTHLGWSKLNIINSDLRKNFKKFENKYFYFIHSYHVKPKLKKDIFANSQHGTKSFCSIVKKENIFGTQFHPEKSGPLGIKFLKNLKKLKN